MIKSSGSVNLPETEPLDSKRSVRYILGLAERAKWLRGRPGPAPEAGASASPVRRIERGAVTEAMINQAARAGERLVLGRRAVLTPLARDRARASGVQIEKER